RGAEPAARKYHREQTAEGMADDHRLSLKAADDRLLVVCDLAYSLAGEYLRVRSGCGHCLWVVGPARCHAHEAGLLEQRHPAVPAGGQEPEPVNEDNGWGARSVRTFHLRCLVLSEGRNSCRPLACESVVVRIE